MQVERVAERKREQHQHGRDEQRDLHARLRDDVERQVHAVAGRIAPRRSSRPRCRSSRAPRRRETFRSGPMAPDFLHGADQAFGDHGHDDAGAAASRRARRHGPARLAAPPCAVPPPTAEQMPVGSEREPQARSVRHEQHDAVPTDTSCIEVEVARAAAGGRTARAAAAPPSATTIWPAVASTTAD